jgi:hypothetical protein
MIGEFTADLKEEQDKQYIPFIGDFPRRAGAVQPVLR